MRPDASENSQISPSTIVRAARAAGSHPHLASVLLQGRKSANIHASSGVIRGILVTMKRAILKKIDSFLGRYTRVPIQSATDRILLEGPQKVIAAELLSAHGNVNPLLRPSVRHFSQNDEDGITLRILDRLGRREPATFLEFGVGDGLENNTLILLAMKWRGTWVGGEPLAFSPANSRLNFIQEWVTKENCVALVRQALGPSGLADVKFASFDLDGNDYHLVSVLLAAGLAPDVFVVEYNAKFPANAEFVMPYDPQHRWSYDDYFGASLRSWQVLFEKAGFQLVACNLTGVNAFFVSKKHSGLFGDIPTEISSLYSHGTYLILPRSGHPTSRRTVEYLISC